MEANAETIILAGQLFADVILGIVIYRLNAATDARNRAHDAAKLDREKSEEKREKVIDGLKSVIDGLKGDVNASAKALIDAEFRTVKHSVANHAQQLTSQMDKLALTFAERDETYSKLFERNPHTELTMVTAINELKDEVRDSTCTKQDYNELRKEVREMGHTLSKIGTLEDLRKLISEVRHG